MAVYAYTTDATLDRIDQILMPMMIADDPLIGPNGLFPAVNAETDLLEWDQRDSYNGLMQWRGLNGDPPRIKRIGAKRFKMEPGYYGEFAEVDEAEMTRRAAVGSFNAPIEISDLVEECQEHLLIRDSNLRRWICSNLLTTGTFIVLDKDGAVGAMDSYKIQIYVAPVTWATSATARPLFDIRQIPVLGRGQSTSFGVGGELWMTQVTWNNMISNTNANDLRGERLDYGQTAKSVADVNLILGRNNLPAIRIYDYGYLDTAGVFHTFIPDNVVVFIGRRLNNQPLGEFRFTKNVNAPNNVGPYNKVINSAENPYAAPPASIRVHRGFSGGPVVYYPGSIFVMQV